MAVGGRVLGEAFVVISPDTESFLADLTAKVKAAVQGVPQQNVKVGADTSPAAAAVAKLKTDLTAALSQLQTVKIGADGGAITKVMAGITMKAAALQKQMANMVLAADTARYDAQIAKKNVELAKLRQQLRSLEMGADTSVIDAAMAKEVAATAGLQRKLSGLQLTLNDAQAAYELKYLESQAEAIREALGDIPGDVEDTLIQAKLNMINARIGVLRSDAKKIELAGNTTLLFSQLTAAEDKLVRLRAEAAGVRLMNEAQIAGVQAQIAAVTAEMGVLRAEADKVRLGGLSMAEITSVAAGIAGLNAEVTKLSASLAGTAVGPPGQALAHLRDQAAKLNQQLGSLDAELTDTAAVAKLAALQLQSEKLKVTLADLSVGGDPIRMAEATRQVAALALGLKNLASPVSNLTPLGERLAGGWGKLNAALAITPSLFGKTMAGFSGFHLIVDALIEATIIAATSLLALAAGAAAAYPAIDQVAYATKNSLTAMTALGVDAGPLAGKLDAVQKAMAPRVIEAYGGALSLLTGQTGVLSKAGTQVVTMFDDWIAKLDIWSRGQKSMGGLLQSGIGFLSQMAKVLGTLGQALDNLLTKDPGVAHFLLDVIQGVASAINLFSKLPAPIVEATLALHGLYLWGKVLAGVLLQLGTSAVNTAKGLLALATNPFFWVAAAAAAIAYMVYETTQADGSTKSFIATLDSGVQTMSASQAATVGISSALGQLHQEMGNTSGLLASEQKNWANLGNTFRSLGFDTKAMWVTWGDSMKNIFGGNALTGVKQFGQAIKDIFVPGAGRGMAVQQDVARLNDELNKLVGQQRNLFAETGALVKQGYTVQQAFALMDAAGVKAGDSFALMQQKVQNLISGYQAMSVQGGILANSINALNFQTEQQDSKVTQLNQAWDTFFKTVTGGATGFNAFATQSLGLYAALGSSADKLTISSGKAHISLQATTAAGKGTAVSMTGLNTASLQARDTFLSTAEAANTQVDNLTLLASAAGLGSKGTDMLTSATKDMVAQMLPAAKGSQEMTDVLYALAQHGGYQGADSFRALAKWVGNTKDPMAALDKITGTLTHDAANLTTDVKNLSVALGQNLNGAMAAAILQASGGQKVFDNFATSVLKSGANTQATQQAAVPLIAALIRMTGSTKDAKAEFETFAQEGLGLTRKQADTLWQESLPKTQQQMSATGKSAKTTADIISTSAKSASGNWLTSWSPWEKFFTQMIPAFVSNTLKLFDGMWSNSAHYFGQYLVTDVGNFFTKTLPHWWDNATGFAKKAWHDVAAAFNSVFLAPLANFFTKWVPARWNDLAGGGKLPGRTSSAPSTRSS